jgi:GNAT superfamily N-acetyltransferase
MRLWGWLVALVAGVGSLSAEVTLLSLKGAQIGQHMEQIQQVCQLMHWAPPFNCCEDEGYRTYLRSYATVPDSFVCLVMEGEFAIGLAAGMPMEKTRPVYTQILEDKGYSLDDFFYVGEFCLQHDRQGQGIEERMMAAIEQHVGHRYASLAHWELQAVPPLGCDAWVCDARFWGHYGFKRKPELTFGMRWKETGATKETNHLATYWLMNTQ